jgi:hypothetical protein
MMPDTEVSNQMPSAGGPVLNAAAADALSGQSKKNNVDAALHALEVFHDLDDVVEIRVLLADGRVESGYFTVANEPKLRTALRSISLAAEGVYFIPNRIDKRCLSRAKDRMVKRPKKTTADADIVERRWLYIDVDFTRPSGTSTSDEEHEAALGRAVCVEEYLTNLGFPKGLLCDSGNCAHLYYRLPTGLSMDEGDRLVKRCLEALAAKFNSGGIEIDIKTANRARITKLFGTVARKGDPTPERPHRLAVILEEPERVEPVPLDLLQALAAHAPQPKGPANGSTNGAQTHTRLDVGAWLAKHEIPVKKGPEPYGDGGQRWILGVCPFNPEHDKDKPAIIQYASGALQYKCQHTTCAANDWHAFRSHFEPNRGARSEEDKKHVASDDNAPAPPPKIFDVATLTALDIPAHKMLIEGLLPLGGVCLCVGKPKAGKSLLAVQASIAVASGHALFGNYRILDPGPVLVLEQDDPGGTASIKEILMKSPVPVADIPFYLVPNVPFCFGELLIDWLGEQISLRRLRLLVLDSYTALRAARKSGSDLVKVEQTDMLLLDKLANRTGCTILVLHHGSKGAAGMEWTEQAAGSFAMTAAVQSQIHVSRFGDLDGTAPERLVRVQGRHLRGVEFVMRFRETTLDYEHLLESSAAALYPLMSLIQSEFGSQPFTVKDLCASTGYSRATSYRLIAKLYHASMLTKRGVGEYSFLRNKIS